MRAVSQTLITEFFPVVQDELPALTAYRLDINSGDFSAVGGKLAYRLKRTFPGHWAWVGNRVVTDEPQPESNIMDVVTTLWAEQAETFRGLRRVSLERQWTPPAQAIAEFVARGLLSDYENEIRAKLSAKRQDLGNAYVERVYDIRGWEVGSEPAVSLSVK